MLKRLANLKNKDVLRESLNEMKRQGNFVCIYPSKGCEEYDKYFDGKVGLSKEEISTLTEEQYKSYTDYEKYRVTYVSPKSIKKGKNTITADLSNMSSINHGLVSSFSKMKKSSVTISLNRSTSLSTI